MNELLRKWPRIKSIFNNLIWILIGIFALILICLDLDSRNGYIKPIASSIIITSMSCYFDAVQIANTPLASLTIAKIFLLIFYCIAAFFIIKCSFGIWSCLSNFLNSIDKTHKENAQKKKEEEYLNAQSQNECDDFAIRMQNATSLYELNELFYEAMGKWPYWYKQLSEVYKERKKWLEENA